MENFDASHCLYILLYWLKQFNLLIWIDLYIILQIKRPIAPMNISANKCEFCIDWNLHLRPFIRETMYSCFCNSWCDPSISITAEIFIFLLIRSTRVHRWGLSLKLNTTMVISVIDKHLEFPCYLHICFLCLPHSKISSLASTSIMALHNGFCAWFVVQNITINNKIICLW